MDTIDLGDVAAIIAAVTGLVIAVGGTLQRRVLRQDIDGVKQEVTTANGQTLAALADAIEGRRVRLDVERTERTAAEQAYVDALDVPGDASRRHLHESPSPEAPG